MTETEGWAAEISGWDEREGKTKLDKGSGSRAPARTREGGFGSGRRVGSDPAPTLPSRQVEEPVSAERIRVASESSKA